MQGPGNFVVGRGANGLCTVCGAPRYRGLKMGREMGPPGGLTSGPNVPLLGCSWLQLVFFIDFSTLFF